MALFDRVQQQQAVAEYFPSAAGGPASNYNYSLQYPQDAAALAPSTAASSETTKSPSSANGVEYFAAQASEQKRGTAKVVVAPPVYAAPMPPAELHSPMQAYGGDSGGVAVAPSQYYLPIQEFVGRGHTVITHPHPDNPTIQEPIVERLVGMNMGPPPAGPPPAPAPQAYSQAAAVHPNMNLMGSYVPPAGQLPSVSSYAPPPAPVYGAPPAMGQQPSYTPCQAGFGSLGSYAPPAYIPAAAGMGSYAAPPMYQQPSYTPPYMGYPTPPQMTSFTPPPVGANPTYTPQATGSYIPPPNGYATPGSYTAPPMMPMMPQYPGAPYMPGYPAACPGYPPMQPPMQPMPPLPPPAPQAKGGTATGVRPPKLPSQPRAAPPAQMPSNETFTLEGAAPAAPPPQTPFPPARAPQYYPNAGNPLQPQPQQQRMPPPPQRMPVPSTISLSARSTYSEPSSCPAPPARMLGQGPPYVPPLTIPQTILPEGPWATIPPPGWQGGGAAAAVDCY